MYSSIIAIVVPVGPIIGLGHCRPHRTQDGDRADGGGDQHHGAAHEGPCARTDFALTRKRHFLRVRVPYARIRRTHPIRDQNSNMSDTLTPLEADHAMRHWSYDPEGDIPIGSALHKRMFCEMLLTTHSPYKPAVIDWPKLDPAALKRVTSLLIWDIAVQTEGRKSIRVLTFAETADDPQLRDALRMNGGEEARRKVVLSKLVEAYGHRTRAGAAVSRARRRVARVDTDGLQRMHRQFLCVRTFRGGAPVGLLSRGARRNLRAGDSGRSAAHSVLRQLGRVVSAQPAMVS